MRLLRLPFNLPPFNGDAEIEAELQEQLEENVLLRAIGLQVLNGRRKGCGEVRAVRLPRSKVAAGQLEYAESEVACKHWVLLAHLFRRPSQPLFCHLRDGCIVLPTGRFRELYDNKAPLAAISRVKIPERVSGCPGSREEVQHERILVAGRNIQKVFKQLERLWIAKYLGTKSVCEILSSVAIPSVLGVHQ